MQVKGQHRHAVAIHFSCEQQRCRVAHDYRSRPGRQWYPHRFQHTDFSQINVGEQRISGIYCVGCRLVYCAGNGKVFRAARWRDKEEVAGWKCRGERDVSVKDGEIGRLEGWKAGRLIFQPSSLPVFRPHNGKLQTGQQGQCRLEEQVAFRNEGHGGGLGGAVDGPGAVVEGEGILSGESRLKQTGVHWQVVGDNGPLAARRDL